MLQEAENPETAVCWWLVPVARRGERCPPPPRAPFFCHPAPAPPRSGWVRMRTGAAPREEKETKRRDTVIHSRLEDETTHESPAPPAQCASRREGPVLVLLPGCCRSFEPKLLPAARGRVTRSPCTKPLVLRGSRGRGRGAGTWSCGRRS